MSLAKASLWTAASTLVKIGAGLLVVKLLAVSFGPAGVGQAGNFRQMVTVLLDIWRGRRGGGWWVWEAWWAGV